MGSDLRKKCEHPLASNNQERNQAGTVPGDLGWGWFEVSLLCVCACVCVHAPTSLVAQMVKNLPAMQETQFQSLGWEDPLEKEMAIHSCLLTWKIPWTEGPGRQQFMGLQRVGHD